jgi:hypothetical protein
LSKHKIESFSKIEDEIGMSIVYEIITRSEQEVSDYLMEKDLC